MARADREVNTGRRGSAMVEFALTFILFLCCSVGIFEFSRLIWTVATVAHAAKQGARFAMMHGAQNPTQPGGTPDTDIELIVEQNAVGLDPNSVDVQVSWSPSALPGSVVRVDVKYDFQFVAAGLISVAGQMEVKRRSEMIVVN